MPDFDIILLAHWISHPRSPDHIQFPTSPPQSCCSVRIDSHHHVLFSRPLARATALVLPGVSSLCHTSAGCVSLLLDASRGNTLVFLLHSTFLFNLVCELLSILPLVSLILLMCYTDNIQLVLYKNSQYLVLSLMLTDL
jgi:hypothetical protein